MRSRFSGWDEPLRGSQKHMMGFSNHSKDGNMRCQVRNDVSAILLLCLVSMTTGCFSGSNELTFKSNQTNQIYPQRFNRAFYSKTEDGRYEVVLMENGIVSGGKTKGPINASTAGPLNQTVQIKVLWKPLHGVKPDAPSATNSVIDWYVQTADSGGDRLHYRGAGFVSVYEGKSSTTFVIRNAQVALSDSTGRLHDPLGDSSVSGSVEAIRNDGMVNLTIEALRQENTKPQIRQASANDGPPARHPGP
jgi:hypothetical protein